MWTSIQKKANDTTNLSLAGKYKNLIFSFSLTCSIIYNSHKDGRYYEW
jgi:hypothetical protein